MRWRVALLCALWMASCGRPTAYSPPRPIDLPPEAIYAGGVDGGDWVACSGVSDGALHCRIFDNESGELRRESWFRYCPQSGGRFSGSVEMVDAAGAHIGAVTLKRDRPDVFHAPADMSPDALSDELKLIAEGYRDSGVNADCSPVVAE